MQKETFILYTQFSEVIGELSDEQAGKIFKALFDYTTTGNEAEFSGILKLAWIPIRQQIDRTSEKYEKKAGANRTNGQLGGRPKKNEGETENPTVISTTEEETEKPHGLNNNHVVIIETQTETQKPNGYFDNPNEAHKAYLVAKKANVLRMASEWKDKIPTKLYDALLKRAEEGN